MVKNIALALQFHQGDLYDAIDLGHLLCDLQDGPREDVEFILYAAKNVGGASKIPQLVQLKKRLAERFKTKLMDCSRYGDGYPHGPNDMWYQLNLDMFLEKREGRSNADVMFTFEADTCPTARNWVDVLLSEYNARGKKILGAISTYNGKRSGLHVNGNMVLPIGFCQENNLYSCPTNVAWDAFHANAFLKDSFNSSTIWNEYKCTEDKLDQWFDNPATIPTIVHGYKGNELRDWVRLNI